MIPPSLPSQAVLFDLDGTLLFLPVDVAELREELREWFLRQGVDLPFQPLLLHLEQAVEQVEKSRGTAAARGARLWAGNLVAQAEVRAARFVQPRVGALRVLRALGARGHPTGVVSNNTRQGIEASLTAAQVSSSLPWVVVSREDVARPKPHPDALVAAMAAFRSRGWPEKGAISPRLYYVGDTTLDAAAAAAFFPSLGAAGVEGISVGVGGGRMNLTPDGRGFDRVVEDDLALERFLLEEIQRASTPLRNQPPSSLR